MSLYETASLDKADGEGNVGVWPAHAAVSAKRGMKRGWRIFMTFCASLVYDGFPGRGCSAAWLQNLIVFDLFIEHLPADPQQCSGLRFITLC